MVDDSLQIPWTAAHRASLPFTVSQSLLKLMCIKSVMPSNHLVLCHPLLLLPLIFPSIRSGLASMFLVQLSVDPWTVACQAPLSLGFPRQEHWNELPFPSLGDLPDSGVKPMSPAFAGGFFTAEPPGKPNEDRKQDFYSCPRVGRELLRVRD